MELPVLSLLLRLLQEPVITDFAGSIEPSRTDGTAAAGQPGIDRCLPGVPLFTEPPRRAVAPRQNVGRLPRCVFPQVPLGGQRRIQRCKVIAISHFPACAVGAARPAGPDVNSGLPGVAFFAVSPHFPLAAVRNRLGRIRGIFHCIPL